MSVHLIKTFITICNSTKLTQNLVCENCENNIEVLGGIKKDKNKYLCGKCKKQICNTCIKNWLK